MHFKDILARLHDGRHLQVADWQMNAGEFWAITGTNGSGKTVLSLLAAERVVLSKGTADNLPVNVSYVSLEAQAEQIETVLKRAFGRCQRLIKILIFIKIVIFRT